MPPSRFPVTRIHAEAEMELYMAQPTDKYLKLHSAKIAKKNTKNDHVLQFTLSYTEDE